MRWQDHPRDDALVHSLYDEKTGSYYIVQNKEDAG